MDGAAFLIRRLPTSISLMWNVEWSSWWFSPSWDRLSLSKYYARLLFSSTREQTSGRSVIIVPRETANDPVGWHCCGRMRDVEGSAVLFRWHGSPAIESWRTHNKNHVRRSHDLGGILSNGINFTRCHIKSSCSNSLDCFRKTQKFMGRGRSFDKNKIFEARCTTPRPLNADINFLMALCLITELSAYSGTSGTAPAPRSITPIFIFPVEFWYSRILRVPLVTKILLYISFVCAIS